jgi:hypothetical protein
MNRLLHLPVALLPFSMAKVLADTQELADGTGLRLPLTVLR